MAIHPTDSKILICAGGEQGVIGFLDVQEDKESQKRNVQAIKVINFETFIVFLVKYTCMIFGLDMARS